jgi:hypothetical protein
MSLYSPKFYRIVYCWSAEKFVEEGLRFCQVFIKNNQALSDPLLVQYTNGTRRFVLGKYLFATPGLAMQYINGLRDDELKALNAQLQVLQKTIDATTVKYTNISVERDPREIIQ